MTIADPPMPVGPVTPQQIRDYQTALIDTAAARRDLYGKNTRIMSAICTCLDIGTTLYLVNKDDKFSEANPLLPNPKTQPGAFIGVKLSVGWFADYWARRGHSQAWDTRAYAGVMCGVSAWNIAQGLK